MKRASYRDAVAWIDYNDEPTSLDPKEIASFISTQIIADIFGVTPEKVAGAVWSRRYKRAKRQAKELRIPATGTLQEK